ncbi:hypothetical protein EYF80_065309 [Liparis tanakae]|uniref:Uncharacterized protein n=1 Tax=Liparis tanakae TaxID=230148 RepID=A0A4Z2E709_9TELE|nr:hypothetical protein EYF80_065309 [Liparis tanakae]
MPNGPVPVDVVPCGDEDVVSSSRSESVTQSIKCLSSFKLLNPLQTQLSSCSRCSLDIMSYDQ